MYGPSKGEWIGFLIVVGIVGWGAGSALYALVGWVASHVAWLP